jgi:hypothetical protein
MMLMQMSAGTGWAPLRNMVALNLFDISVRTYPTWFSWMKHACCKRKHNSDQLPSREPSAEIQCDRILAQNSKASPQFVTRMDAVVHYVINTPQVKSLLSISSHDYLPHHFEPVRIENDIYFQLLSLDHQDGSVQSLRFKLFSYEHDVQYLQRFVDSCNQDYERRMANKLGSSLYFFDQIVQHSQKRGQQALPSQFLVFRKHKFSTTRTFDNVFFEGQERVRKHTEFFLHNKGWYERKGIPYTLGFLFHGDPGCGKTSETKAIANIARRHIINVQLSEIKTKTQLTNLFFNDEINVHNGNALERYTIPIHERLYVIEDIDAMGDMVLRREWKKPTFAATAPKSTGDAFLDKLAAEEEEFKDPLDLSFLLNLLDGTLESSGRILVITSNFPERIDRALIRPGRIDQIVHFTRCSLAVLKNMVSSFYDLDDPFPHHTIWTKESDLHHRWSPAEVNQILFRNFDTPSHALDELLTLQPPQLYGFPIEDQQEDRTGESTLQTLGTAE